MFGGTKRGRGRPRKRRMSDIQTTDRGEQNRDTCQLGGSYYVMETSGMLTESDSNANTDETCEFKADDRVIEADDRETDADDRETDAVDRVIEADDSVIETDDKEIDANSKVSEEDDKRNESIATVVCDNQPSPDSVIQEVDQTKERTESHENDSQSSCGNLLEADDKTRSVETDNNSARDDLSGFRFVDVNLLVCFISRFPCPSCQKPYMGHTDPKHVTVEERKTGAATLLVFTCGSCGACQSLTNSARAGPSYEVNSRFHAAMFTIGNNNKKAQRFCSTMKMPEPPPLKPWMNRRT